LKYRKKLLKRKIAAHQKQVKEKLVTEAVAAVEAEAAEVQPSAGDEEE